jgi:hypothetical protein
MSNEAKRSWRERVVENTKNLMVIVVYLWALLTVFQLHRAIILAEHNIQYRYAQGLLFALINAWILAKFVLIGESLHVGERWHSKPLLHSILFKSAVFGAILMVCRIVEGALGRIWRARSFAAGLPELSISTLIDEFSLMLIVIVALIPFFAAREFSRVLGKSEWTSLLFRHET